MSEATQRPNHLFHNHRNAWTRHLLRLGIFVAVAMTFATTLGCRQETPQTVGSQGGNTKTITEAVDPTTTTSALNTEASATALAEGTPADDNLSAARRQHDAFAGKVRELIQTRQLDDAALLVQERLVQRPDDGDLVALSAHVAYASGRPIEAVQLLDAAVDLESVTGKNYAEQAAEVLASTGRWEEAISRFKGLVAESPDNDDLRRKLADLLNARGFRFDGNEQVRELCRRGGAAPRELQGLASPTRSYAGLGSKPDVSDAKAMKKIGRLNAARGLFSEGDLDDAIVALQDSDLVKKKDPAAYALLGQILQQAQRFDLFAQWLKDVPNDSQRYPEYWMAIGGWATQNRQFESAVHCFGEAIVREPGDAAANLRMTAALRSAGNEKAAKLFDQRNKQINQILQRVKFLLGETDPDPAAIFELSQKLSNAGRPLESVAWYQLGAERLGGSEAAIQKVAAMRNQVIAAEGLPAARSAWLCGLSLSDYSLETDKLLKQQRQAETSIASGEAKGSTRSAAAAKVPVFANVAQDVGIDFRYQNAATPVLKEFRIFQAYGAGVACLDYDLDGWVDFYLGQAAGEPHKQPGVRPNLLTRNLSGQFKTVTNQANCDDRGYAFGITSGDWNQDGFPDLVIGNLGRNRLLINQGDGSFREQPMDSVWEKGMFTTSLAMGDVSGDHLPDIVEVNYLDDPKIFEPLKRKPDGTPVGFPGPLHFRPAIDRIFESRGNGQATGSTLAASNEKNTAATGLGVLLTNLNSSVGNEIFVANDLMPNDYFQQHSANKGWSEDAASRGLAVGANGNPLACMGIAAADVDGNGHTDLFITNFEDQWANLYVQSADGFFRDLVVAFGLSSPTYKMLGFGAQALDFDNNGTIELVAGNGHIEDFSADGKQFKMPTQLFVQKGSSYQEIGVKGDDNYWNAGHLSRALATCDYNNDGRIDIAVTDLIEPFALLQNQTKCKVNRWLQLQLVGSACERDAVGSKVTVVTSKQRHVAVVQSGDGYLGKNQSIMLFGFGPSETTDSISSIEVQWADGQSDHFENVGYENRWLLVQGADSAFALLNSE